MYTQHGKKTYNPDPKPTPKKKNKHGRTGVSRRDSVSKTGGKSK